MDNTMYVALSRQVVLQRELDVVANNMANVDTAGFKVESLTVAQETRTLPTGSGGRSSVDYVLDSGVARDFSQGALKRTGSPYDLAIAGDGFFQVSTQAGPRYTRDGRFGVDAQGRITTASGQAVLDAGGGEITLDPEKGQPTIGADGTISQQDQVIGKVGVVRFASAAALSKDGDGLYRNDSNLQPQPAADARIRQGMVEGSNVQAVQQMTKLISVSRAYESIAKMISNTADLSSNSIDRLGRVS